MASFTTIGKQTVLAFENQVNKLFVYALFFDRKQQENEYLEHCLYKVWYNDSLSCMLH